MTLKLLPHGDEMAQTLKIKADSCSMGETVRGRAAIESLWKGASTHPLQDLIGIPCELRKHTRLSPI